MNKNCLYLLIGCAMFLCAGACGRKAYAVDYPNAATLEDYWKKTLYYQAFEKLYRQAEEFPLLSDNLPKDGQTPSFKMYFNGKENPFKTAADLNRLPCDACLKKICKVLCSSEFLEAVLMKKTVGIFRTEAQVITIRIGTSNSDPFFDKYEKEKLKMHIECDTDVPDRGFQAWFVFIFKKEKDDVSIQMIRLKCALRSGYRDQSYYRTVALSDFPSFNESEVSRKIKSTWSGLPRNPVIVKTIFPDIPVKWSNYPSDCSKATQEKLFCVISNLRSEDFFKGIFGERMLDFFKHERSVSIYEPGLWIGYVLMPIYRNNSLFGLDIRLWIMNAAGDKILPNGPETSSRIWKKENLYDECLNVVSDPHFVLISQKTRCQMQNSAKV